MLRLRSVLVEWIPDSSGSSAAKRTMDFRNRGEQLSVKNSSIDPRRLLSSTQSKSKMTHADFLRAFVEANRREVKPRSLDEYSSRAECSRSSTHGSESSEWVLSEDEPPEEFEKPVQKESNSGKSCELSSENGDATRQQQSHTASKNGPAKKELMNRKRIPSTAKLSCSQELMLKLDAVMGPQLRIRLDSIVPTKGRQQRP